MLKEVWRDLEGEGEGKQEQEEGETKAGCDGGSSAESLLHLIPGHLWMLSSPDARGLSILTPHLSSLAISHPGQQGVNPEACLPIQMQIQGPLQIALNLCFLISKKGNNIHIYLIF